MVQNDVVQVEHDRKHGQIDEEMDVGVDWEEQ